jgi:DNA-binding transcriptional MocR family regulator
MSNVWIPRIAEGTGSAYLGIVEALASDLASGAVLRGARLLPQREMAERLGLSVGTVAKAYAEAARRGLISGEVGRGTFVNTGSHLAARPAPSFGAPVDMSLNAPPDTGAAALIAQAMAELAQSGEVDDLLDYLPHAGLPAHRAAMADWLNGDLGLDLPADRVMLCNGAQHGIALALMAALRPGDAVLVEEFTYPGIVSIAERLGHTLHGVALDGEGLIPEALDAAFARTGARALYCMPTLQTPTGAVMSTARREAIAAVLRRHDAWAIEDDVYAFLAPAARPALAFLAPERVCYVTTLAKSLAPGLRAGALVVPEALRNRINAALRGTGWMAAPLLTAIAARMLRAGIVADQAVRKRAVAAQRWQIARDILGERVAIGALPAFHLWLPIDTPPTEIVAYASMRGVVLAAPVTASGMPPQGGIRLCLGAPPDLDALRRGLSVVAEIIDQGGRALV